MNELDVTGKMPISKAEQECFSNNLINFVLNGEVDPIQAIVKARSFYDSLKLFVDNSEVKEAVIKEVEKNGKCASWNGVTLTLRELGVKYDFSGCNDPIYQSLVSQKKELDDKIKERESFLKNVPEDTTILDENTGEVSRIIPAIRMASYSYVVSFPK